MPKGFERFRAYSIKKAKLCQFISAFIFAHPSWAASTMAWKLRRESGGGRLTWGRNIHASFKAAARLFSQVFGIP
jgi:uncharacterized membrane protein YbhN (UPF0104 family)